MIWKSWTQTWSRVWCVVVGGVGGVGDVVVHFCLLTFSLSPFLPFSLSKVQLLEMEDVSQAYMDFTITEEVYGSTRTIPLVEGGEDMDVTNDNVRDYVQALVKYHMLNSIKDQLSEFLQGFYDVIPQPLLSIFDHREIELVLCGLPNIDKADWRKNTLYAGMYEAKGDAHKVIGWFWKLVNELEDADAARLLQFSTGTARVPVQGFKLLQGRDGDVSGGWWVW